MHELSLIADLLRKIEAISREQGSRRVTGVKVRIGALAHISADHFRDHFTHAVHGTVAEGAWLETETLTDIADPHAQEILLDSVEVED
ncbi:MAG: hydrogenase/urease maturation nickel metallochaperone HypA [Blastocatellia bacterium]